MLRRYLPILDWGRSYSRDSFTSDIVAAVIVTIMLVPQSLAYALLAGLPAEVGLYASILPILLYTVFGTSRTLAVGPVAVASLMTAAAVGEVARAGTPEYLGAAILLAFLSGFMLTAMGLARLGFLAAFLSRPVISGFISASGLLIAAAQVKHLLGVDAGGQTLPEIARSVWAHLGAASLPTLLIGAGATAFLFWARTGMRPLLVACGMAPGRATILARTGPVIAVVATTVLAALLAALASALGLPGSGIRTVGEVPSGLPLPALPPFDADLWARLAVPALLISVVGYVETISVAQTLAAKRRQRIDPDQELVALGAANLGAAVSGGFPVTGGFARSVVNFDAGAETPAAGAYTAVMMALATLTLTPLLYYLPQATLAATIVVAVLSLVDLKALPRIWAYSRADGAAMAATILVTLFAGVERGILAGVALSLTMHLYRTSRPHVAIVGQVPGTEHFRNVRRHEVVTAPDVVTIRVDESLYFANARFLEDVVQAEIAANPRLAHVVLMCPAVNAVDASALESLEAINQRLKDGGVRLHLSEVKGPVMDRLRRSHLLSELTGEIFLTQCDAMRRLAPALTEGTLRAARRGTNRVGPVVVPSP
jgi:SulP family sulfate permease